MGKTVLWSRLKLKDSRLGPIYQRICLVDIDKIKIGQVTAQF